MIEKGKIPMAVVSFDLENNKPGKVYRYRSPFYDLSKGDVVIVNNKNGIELARVVSVDWVSPGPVAMEKSCVISYCNPERLLRESLELQVESHAIAVRQKQHDQQRKEEIESTIRELQKEILKLIKELDTL